MLQIWIIHFISVGRYSCVGCGNKRWRQRWDAATPAYTFDSIGDSIISLSAAAAVYAAAAAGRDELLEMWQCVMKFLMIETRRPLASHVSRSYALRLATYARRITIIINCHDPLHGNVHRTALRSESLPPMVATRWLSLPLLYAETIVVDSWTWLGSFARFIFFGSLH